MRHAIVALPILLVLMLMGCGSIAPAANLNTASEELSGKLAITGSSTIAPVILEIAKRFEKKHPGVRVDVQTGGSSRGVADTQKGLAQIGLASRALKAEEQIELKAFPLAVDGVCVILHKDNPISELSSEQIIAIYTGKLLRWNEAGGLDRPITVVNKAEGRSTLELFSAHFKLQPRDIKASVVIGDNEHGIKTVAGNPDAIGYVSIGSAEYAASNGIAVKLLGISSVPASIENVRNGKFPLSRPLNLVTKGEPTGLTKAFIDFCRAREHHDIIQEQYFVPIE